MTPRLLGESMTGGVKPVTRFAFKPQGQTGTNAILSLSLHQQNSNFGKGQQGQLLFVLLSLKSTGTGTQLAVSLCPSSSGTGTGTTLALSFCPCEGQKFTPLRGWFVPLSLRDRNRRALQPRLIPDPQYRDYRRHNNMKDYQ